MAGEREKPSGISRIRAHGEEMSKRRAILRDQALKQGLRQYPARYSRVWVGEEHKEGVIPERFFLEDYMDTGTPPSLEEFRFKLPITTTTELIDALRTLDAFYYGTVDIVNYARHGVYGLIDYLEKFDQIHPGSQESKPSKEVIKSVSLPTERVLYKDRIVSNPEILVGKPTIRGTRLSVELVLGYLAGNFDTNELKSAYPGITDEDIKACLGYVHALVAGDLKQLRRHRRKGIPFFTED